MTILERLQSRLHTFEPFISLNAPCDAAQSAVLMAILPQPTPALLLTRRASHLDIHPGQVAFPGGMQEPSDTSLLTTALRESEEEIGLRAEKLAILGRLSPVYSPHNIAVHPYIALVQSSPTLIPSPDEVESIFTLPLNYLLTTPPSQYCASPCYYYEQYKIWGLTAKIIVEFTSLIR